MDNVTIFLLVFVVLSFLQSQFALILAAFSYRTTKRMEEVEVEKYVPDPREEEELRALQDRLAKEGLPEDWDELEKKYRELNLSA